MTTQGQQSALTHALTDQAVQVVFQPIWRVSGAPWGFEALSRFPNGSAPDTVWALAHEQGLATALDRVALGRAMDAGRQVGGPLFLNVSGAHFREPEALAALGPPAHIVWEVTERDPLDEEDVQGIRWLQDRGYAIAMDDAGSARSTMPRLTRLHPNIVKLDRPLVQQWAAGVREPLRQWVRAATAIGATVIAEGVEDVSWMVGLAWEGVHAAQGYALNRPAPAEHWVAHPRTEFLWGG